MAEKTNNANTAYGVALPKDLETEMVVLGTLIRRNELYQQVDDILLPDAFSGEKNEVIFRCIRWIIKSGKIADINSICEAAVSHKEVVKVAVDENDVFYVASRFSENTFYQDVDRLVNFSRRRKAWTSLQQMSNRVIDLTEDVDKSLEELQKDVDYLKGLGSVEESVIDARAALGGLNQIVQQNQSGLSPYVIKTGFQFTDFNGGLRLGELTALASFSGYGKTALSLCMAVNMAKNGTPVAFFSKEMSSVELWARILSGPSGISSNRIMTGKLNKEELERFDKAVAQFVNIPLYIDEGATSSIDKTLRSLRTLVLQKGVKVFFVDYLQIFVQTGNGDREESSLSSMIRRLKNACTELSLCGIALSQLRRDKEEQHPRMDMLRGSGQIEESCDNVVLIDRPEARPEWGIYSYKGKHSNVEIKGTAEINVSKGRNIGTSSWIVSFIGATTQFAELDKIPYKKKNKDKKEDDAPAEETAQQVTQQRELPFEPEGEKAPF